MPSPSPMTGGQIAAMNGQAFKVALADEMQRIMPSAQRVGGSASLLPPMPYKDERPLLLTELQLIDGSRWDVAWFDRLAFPHGLALECKFQSSPGTAYDKLAHSLFTAADTRAKMSALTLGLVCEGAAFAKGAGRERVLTLQRWRSEYALPVQIFGSQRDFLQWWRSSMTSYGYAMAA